MVSYFAFVHSGIESAGNPLSDGRNLAVRCLEQRAAIPDSSEFPPKLLILLASPAYLDSLKAEQLLAGIHERFTQAGHRNVPLIGCSVAAVFFDRHIHHEGALLVCLASRLLEAKVGAVSDASRNPKEAVKTLLHDLQLRDQEGQAIHSFVNRSMLAFFPGFGGDKYMAPGLHAALCEQLESRISIFGGVASANDPKRQRSGILFANRNVYRDAIVAARLEHGTPFGNRLSQGLTDTNKTVNVAALDPEDPRVIHEFREGTASEVMNCVLKTSDVPLFAEFGLDTDPIVDLPVPDGNTIRLSREVKIDRSFHVLKAEPNKIRATLRSSVEHSMDRAFLFNPVGALGFRCVGLLRNEKSVGLDLEHDAALIETDLSGKGIIGKKSYVGGFVDGEAALDRNGKSLLGNWSSANLVFGDELRFRTPVYRGFEKVTEFAGAKVAENQKEGTDRLTKLIYDIGFPGALLSFCMFDQDGYSIVGKSASGPRYERILKKKLVYSIDSDDLIAEVARSGKAQAVIDARQQTCPSMRAATEEGIVSQYLVPLIGYDDQVNAVLQIDLGDLSYDTKLYQTETIVLESLGNIVSAALKRILVWEESKLIHLLDRAMNACQSSETIKDGLQQYLDSVLAAFELNKGEAGGHIRLAQEDNHCLRLVAGDGGYYEAARLSRQQIDFDDPSPTAQAFRDERLLIINDPKNNQLHQAMLAQSNHPQQRLEMLQRVGSYANVPFESERGERGTINLVAEEPWFFAAFHRPVLEALGHRIGFLLETLRRKEWESFLLAVSPTFSQIRRLDDAGVVLANEFERFAKAIKAEVASVYLWDSDRQRYILRGQYNWAKPAWVGAAYYEGSEFWAGATALAGKPHYISDLSRYYRKYSKTSRRYAESAFGRELSKKFTVEVIALQLRVGATRLGVATFYRPIASGKDVDSGFITTNTDLLQQGADNFASLISILESTRRETWRKHEHKRRQEVFEATFEPARDDLSQRAEPFEYRVARQLLRSYHAAKVNFFKVHVDNDTPKADLKQSLGRHTKTLEVMTLPLTVNESERNLVEQAIKTNYRGEQELKVERVSIAEGERDPKRMALDRLVSRVVIPLFSERRLVGVLDVHWAFDHTNRHTLDYQHNDAFLLMIGDMVGAAYDRDQTQLQIKQAREEAEAELARKKTEFIETAQQSRSAFEATTVYVLHNHHEIRNVITRLVDPLESLMELREEATGEEMELFHTMSTKLDEGRNTLNEMIEIGQEVMNPNLSSVSTFEMLDEVIAESIRGYASHNIEIRFSKESKDLESNGFKSKDPGSKDPKPKGPLVWVDQKLVHIALHNLVDNAFKYMVPREPRVLTVRVERMPIPRNALVTIEDTGIGMTEEKIRQLREDFHPANGKIGLGVMLSRLILGLNGGSLRYESIVGTGTKTFITLPLDPGAHL